MNRIYTSLVGISLVAFLLPAGSIAQTAPMMNPVASCMDFPAFSMGADNANHPEAQTAILNLQLALTKEGFSIDQTELGHFGSSTRTAVKAFQEKYVDDILVPFGLRRGTGFPGVITRLKLQALYGCRQQSPAPNFVTPLGGVKLAITNLSLDADGVSATFCNLGTTDLPTAPFRIRLNGINRDFEEAGAQKAGACVMDTWKYETWGLTYDPGSTYTAIGLLDPNNVYKASTLVFPSSASTTIGVPALPGAHLSVRSVILKSTGVQATFCNLGTTTLSSFPVRITVNGTIQNFDISEVYNPGKCQAKQWAYTTWGLPYVQGSTYSATVVVDPNNVIQETNEFDNVATVVGTP